MYAARHCSELLKDISDAFGGTPIPKRRNASSFCSAFENSRQFKCKLPTILANQDIGSHRDRDWAFGVAANSETGHLQVSRFLLDPTRVRNNSSGAPLQRKEFDIRYGFEEMQLVNTDTELCDPRSRTRMNGKDNFQLFAHV